MVVAGAKRTRGWGERLLVGVTPEMFARKPNLQRDGKPFVIDTNHPAFVYGHLALYPAKVLDMLGLERSHLTAPAGFEELFKDGTVCHDDAKGTIYPAMETITSNYFRCVDGALEAIAKLDDSAFPKEIPAPFERFRDRFPSVGSVVMFMMNNHQAMHFGQISAWRRCMGLGPA